MLRIIFAVITGYLVFGFAAALLFQFTGHDPHLVPSVTFGVTSVVYGMISAALAGLVATRMAQRPGMTAAIAVGVLMAAGAILSIVMQPGKGSMWSQWSTVFLMAPCTYAGGVYYHKKKRATSTPG